jgi:SET domain-containing protein
MVQNGMSGRVENPEPETVPQADIGSAAVRAPLAVRDFGPRGRGIVALENIEPGRLVERSPVLIIPSEERFAVDNTVVFTYVFMWEHHTVEEDLYKHRGRSAIALGYTSLLSHSYEPNCIFVRHIDELFIDVFAKRKIRRGEELTIDYQMTLWFDPVRID